MITFLNLEILATYQEQIIDEIEGFEKNLLLQQDYKQPIKKIEEEEKKIKNKRFSLFKVKPIKENATPISKREHTQTPRKYFTPKS